MTRINLVVPSELSDQHLVAEYREIFMVGSSLQRSMKSKNWEKTLANIPKKYTLNIGHVTFFYDKGKYLYKRYDSLVEEMKKRGMNPNPERRFKTDQWPKGLFKDWEPEPEDYKVIRARIKEKIEMKPEWYRFSSAKLFKRR